MTSPSRTVTMVLPDTILHKSPETAISEIHKISLDKNIKQKHTNIKHKNFKELVPSVLPLLKKAHKPRTCWYCGPFCQFMNTRFKNVLKKRKGMDRSNEKFRIYKYITANTSAIWYLLYILYYLWPTQFS